MGKDIPLGHIRGIKVGMNVSVFLFAGFISVYLATSELPRALPDQSSAAYWAAAVIASVLFFLSLLIHEIGHALVARDEGIGVESMGLTLLGGVTRMTSSPTTPGAEFRVSVVGPIASATCGVVFLVQSFLLPNDGLWGLAGVTFFVLGYLNIVLAILNMIPAAPLDGGKVLSSIIWRATGDQYTAMIWSAGAGVGVGAVLAYIGYNRLNRPAQVGQPEWLAGVNGWFTIIVGAFVAYSAFQQLRSAPLYRALDGLTVADAMAADPPTAASWATVGEFLRTSSPRPEHQAYPVVGPDGEVSGLLTAAAIRAVPPETWETLPITSLAYPLDRLTIVQIDEQLLPALQKVETGDIRHALVVVPDGRIVGTLEPSVLDRIMSNRTTQRQPSRV